MFKQRTKQLGQGMTEYIVIVALVAISAIAVYNLFGDTVRGQVGDLAAELGGGTSQGTGATAAAQAQTAGQAQTTLGSFSQDEGGN
ncbi:Flp family type IVb pilin [Litorivicinus lipolyticus]|uniref:Flp family type IVb pilin n=1 Tax=Litorivicinus lipolyticus TaxID=418701 RepID=UPI003B59DC60